MTFTRTNTWATRTLLTSTQVNNMDLNITRAVDGYAGGTYAPSSAIVIGGSGLQVTGASVFDGSIDFNGAARFDTGPTFYATATFNAGITVASGTVSVASPIVLSGTGHVTKRVATGVNNGNTTIGGNVYVIGDADIIRVTNTNGGNVVYQLGVTGASTGDIIEVYVDSTNPSTNTVEIYDTTPTSLVVLSKVSAANGYAKFVFASSLWRLMSVTKNP